MKIQQIKNLSGEDINNMDTQTLIEYSKEAMRNTKQRLSFLKRAGGNGTPASRILEQRIGKNIPNQKDLENMDHNQLKHFLASTSRFLNSQTSTLEGEERRLRNIIKASMDTKGLTNRQVKYRITQTINKFGGLNKMREVFDLIDQIEELDPSIKQEMGTNPADGFFAKVFESYNSKDFYAFRDDPVRFIEKLRNEYDERKRLQQDGFEDFEF